MRISSDRPWTLVRWDRVPPGARVVPPGFAVAWVDDLIHDPHRRAELFDVWESLTNARRHGRGHFDAMEMQRSLGPLLRRAIETGQVVVVTDEGNEARYRVSITQPPGEVAPPPAPEKPTPVKTWIEFEVVDMAGQPQADRKYRATLTDGSVKKGKTDSKGLVRFDQLEPGLCEFVLEGLDGDAWETAEGTEWIEFLVTDPDEKPLAGVRYEAKLTNGGVKQGVTGKNGLVRFDGLQAGICEFRLPDFDADDVWDGSAGDDWIELLVTDAKDRPKSGVACEVVWSDGTVQPAKSDDAGLVRFENLKKGKVQVRFPDAEAELVVASGGPGLRSGRAGKGVIEFELQDVDGKPVPGVRFVAEGADGTAREGVTDDAGRGRIEGVEEGEHSLSFPDVDASAWEAA